MTTKSCTPKSSLLIQSSLLDKVKRFGYIEEPERDDIIFKGQIQKFADRGEKIPWLDINEVIENEENIKKCILTKQQPYCKGCRNALVIVDKIKGCCNKCKYIRLLTDQEIINYDHAQTYPELYRL